MFIQEKDLGGIKISANAKVTVTDLALIQLLAKEQAKIQVADLDTSQYYYRKTHTVASPYEAAVGP